MSVVAANLIVKVSAEGVQQTADSLKQVGDHSEEASGGLKGFLGNMLGIAGGITVAELAQKGFELLADQVKECVTAGEEFQQTQAQTVAVLKSTHDASGMSVQGINDLAESLSRVTPFSAETTQSAENMLLTFTNIGKNVFPQATKTALDMAQALGGDAKQQALQLGIALNDPEKGIGRLTRVGVTFTDSQKKLIKSLEQSGNMAGAQSVVLKELQREFGGSAKAAGQTFAGSLQIAQNQLEIAREKIGTALLPMLASLMQHIAPLVSALADKLPGAIDFLGKHIQQIAPFVAGLGITLASVVVPALIALVAPMAAAALSAVAMAAPFILVGLAIGGVITYFKHLYDTSVPFRAAINMLMAVLHELATIIVAHLQKGLQSLMPFLQQAAKWIGGELQQAGKAIFPVIMQAVEAITKFAMGLSTKLGPAIDNVFGFIRGALHVLGVLWKAAWPTMQGVIEGVWNVIQGVVKIAWSVVSGIINVGLDILGGKWGKAWDDLKGMLSGVWDGIKQVLKGAWQSISTLVSSGFNTVKTLFTNAGHDIIQGLINGVKGMIGNAVGAVKDVGNSMLSGIKNLFGVHSPSTVFAEIGANLSHGLIQGVRGVDVSGPIGKHLAGAIPSLAGNLTVGVGAISGRAPALAGGVYAGAGPAGVGFGGAGAGAGGAQVVQLVMNDAGLRVLARGLMPYIAQNARLAAGIRTM